MSRINFVLSCTEHKKVYNIWPRSFLYKKIMLKQMKLISFYDKLAQAGNKLISIHWFQVADGDGKEAHMILWNHPGVDVTGMVGRCEKVAGSCEQVL